MLKIAEPFECVRCPLQNCEGLRPLEESQLSYMQSVKEGEFLFERGDTVFTEEDEITHVYTLLQGILIRFRSLEDGRRQIVNFMFPGDLVGLQGAFEEPATHSVEALTPVRLCHFTRSHFVDLIKENPRLGYDLTWLAAKEEAALESHIVSLGQRSAKERVVFLAVWLLDRAQATGVAEQGNSLAVSITQAQIADMLGLSLVHTNRTIRALDTDGVVEWGARMIRVPDMEAAANAVHFDRSDKGVRPFI